MIELTLLNGNKIFIAKRKISHMTIKNGEGTFVGFDRNNSCVVKESINIAVDLYKIAKR